MTNDPERRRPRSPAGHAERILADYPHLDEWRDLAMVEALGMTYYLLDEEQKKLRDDDSSRFATDLFQKLVTLCIRQESALGIVRRAGGGAAASGSTEPDEGDGPGLIEGLKE